ncbi:MAG: TonB-dependent receptor [Ignavibacteriaceae bacterium]
MILLRRFLLIISILLISATFLQAQEGKGQIQGTVKDSTTGDVLYGANVWLQGTSMGAATDMEGKYRIHNVPAGSYTMVIRYIGYRQKEMPINLVGGRTLELNIDLPSEVIEGKPVVVTAQAVGQREAINQQLTSNTIINVVSAEKIRELPDDNAATALSRLPGVSLMNGDQVVIRGIQAKLNQVLVNGIELPSTDLNNRATDLGFISSNMLSGIEVIKALTPDMDANTLGGVVNLKLREAPTGLHFDVLAQGDYNSSDRVTDNYKFWASISQRFFDDKLGVFLQGNMDRTDGGNQIASITPSYLGTTQNEYGQATYISTAATYQYASNIVKNSGGSLILDYRLPNGKIVFQNTYAGNVTDQLNNYTLINFTNNQVLFTPDRSLYGKDLWINALQAENTFGDIKVALSLSHSATEQYTIFGYAPGINGAGWNQFYNANSTAPFGYDGSGKAITYSSQTSQQNMTLTKALGIFDNLNPEDASGATIQGWPSSLWNQFYQHLYNASLDVSAPVNFTKDINVTFKAGGKYLRTTRENNIDEDYAHGAQDLYLNPAANAYLGVSPSNPVSFPMIMNNDFKRGKYYLSDLYNFTNGGYKYTLDRTRYDTWLQLSEQGWLVPRQYADSYKNDWRGAEQFSAGYAMGTFNIGPKLTVLGGARFESYNMIYHAQYTYVLHTVYGDAASTEGNPPAITVNDSTKPFNPHYKIPYSAFNVDRTDNNVFPDVQLQYKVNDWADLRLAYSTGISRPDYTAIIPKVAFYDGNIELGNPLLKPATGQNFDIVATFHNNYIGLFTVDAFYKVLKNQMYNTNIYYANRAQYADYAPIPDSAFLKDRFGFTVPMYQQIALNLNNPNLGFIRGIEIDWQTNFWYLPAPLNSLVLDVNYTKSGSNTAYNILRLKNTRVIDPITHRVHDVFTTEDTTYVGRLIQQANDVVNVALGVDYKGFSGRISFSMTGNLLNSVGSRPEETSFTGNYYRWDFAIKQQLPIDGLSLAVNGVNIFNNGVSTYRNYRMRPGAPITKNLTQVLYSPTIFQLNLRYTF